MALIILGFHSAAPPQDLKRNSPELEFSLSLTLWKFTVIKILQFDIHVQLLKAYDLDLISKLWYLTYI